MTKEQSEYMLSLLSVIAESMAVIAAMSQEQTKVMQDIAWSTDSIAGNTRRDT